MWCFPWSSESSANKRQCKKRKSRNDDRSKPEDEHVTAPPSDFPKTDAPTSIEKNSQLVSHSNTEKSEDVSHSNTDKSQVVSHSNTDGARDETDCRLPHSNAEMTCFRGRKFALADLVDATKNFNEEYFLGEGGFGSVYKGRLKDNHEIVAIKQLDRNGTQGIREFVVEVLTLSNAEHTNLVELIGYSAEGDQRLLVYEYMPLGSLEDHLHGSRSKRKNLDWNKRMKVAAGAAKGLQYLHTQMNPPVIYRDLKCSNILLGKDYHPKLSDFGLAKVGPSGDQTHVSTRVMGTYGYCAPDYAMTGQLTFKSDIYSFGVMLLEIISGRKAIDRRRPGPEQNIVDWAKPMFRDRKKFPLMADPILEGQYPIRGLYQVLAIAAMCIQEQPSTRPQIGDIVKALTYLASQTYDPSIHPLQQQQQQQPGKCMFPVHKDKTDETEDNGSGFEEEEEVSPQLLED